MGLTPARTPLLEELLALREVIRAVSSQAPPTGNVMNAADLMAALKRTARTLDKTAGAVGLASALRQTGVGRELAAFIKRGSSSEATALARRLLARWRQTVNREREDAAKVSTAL